MSAIKNKVTPLNTSVTGISFLTPATTKQFKPIGGVIRQTSAILTTIIPNQTLTWLNVIPNGLSAAVTSGPPFNNITAGYTTGSVSNNNPIASINIPKITYPRSINKSVTYGSKGSDIIQLAKSSGSPENPKNLILSTVLACGKTPLPNENEASPPLSNIDVW